VQKAIRLLKSTETVVRTYERTKLWRDAPAMYQREFALIALYKQDEQHGWQLRQAALQHGCPV
jgi:hypothetical protein